jgi:hypothetical protein
MCLSSAPVCLAFRRSNRNLAITETHIFSPQAINQFRFGFSRNVGQSVAGGTLTDQDVGINSPNGTQEGLPQIDVLGALSLGIPITTEAKQPVITSTFPTSYSYLGASTIFVWAQKSSEISSTI